MKTTKLLAVILLTMNIMEQFNIASAQQLQPATKDIQVSASVSNAVLHAGSTLSVVIQIKNLSNHVITIPQEDHSGFPQFAAHLIDVSGNTHKFKSKVNVVTAVWPPIAISAGQTVSWTVSIPIPKKLSSGNYKLKVFLHVRMHGEYYDIESDLLHIRVIV
jgi:hypothetical protein